MSACAYQPEHLRLTPESMANRQLQTRVFETDDEARVLAASSAVLQDLGFLIDESEQQLGLLVGSKMRSAINPVEVTAMVILAVLAQTDPIYSEKQLMRISLVTTPPSAGRTGTSVRVTFQRIVYDNRGGIARQEAIGTPEIYQEFFAKLSKALFLEDQQL
jgi:hypothetical protein